MAIAEIIKAKKIALPSPDCKELILDGHKIRTISKDDAEILAQLGALETLSFNQTQLNSIAELPLLDSLTSMELQDNKLTGASCIQLISQRCPNLQLLLLAGNKFTNLEEFSALKELKKLEEFDFSMNPVSMEKTAEEKGRQLMFQLIPQLKIVNGRDAEGNEVVFSGDDDEEDSAEEDESESENEDSDVAKKGSGTVSSRRNSLLSEFMNKNYEDDDDNEEEDFNPDSYSEDTSDVNDDEEDEDEPNNNNNNDNNDETTTTTAAAGAERQSAKNDDDNKSPIKRRRSSDGNNSSNSSSTANPSSSNSRRNSVKDDPKTSSAKRPKASTKTDA